METIVKIGGLYHVGFVIFHLLFSRLFNWPTDLRNLTFVNSAIMRVLNLCLTFVFGIFAYISLHHSTELVTTSLGQNLLVLISLFWLIRAIEQAVFFKLKHWVSAILFIIFLSGTAVYAIPAVQALSA